MPQQQRHPPAEMYNSHRTLARRRSRSVCLHLDPTKTVQSITLPNNVNVEVVAMTLVAS
jgi:hypothetical protein